MNDSQEYSIPSGPSSPSKKRVSEVQELANTLYQERQKIAELAAMVNRLQAAPTPAPNDLTHVLGSLADAIKGMSQNAGPTVNGTQPNGGPMGDSRARTGDVTKFAGKREDLERFVAEMDLKFLAEPRNYATDTSRVVYLGLRTEGVASDWFRPKLCRDSEGNLTGVLPSYGELLKDLRRAFGDPDVAATAARRLGTLKQKGSLTRFTAEFRRLISHLEGYGEAALKAAYYDGLSDNVKDDLRKQMKPHDPKVGLEDLIALAVDIDGQQYAREMEKKNGGRSRSYAPYGDFGRRDTGPALDSDGDTPMGGLYGAEGQKKPLTEKERLRRRTKGLCFICGEAGHRRDECPERKKGKPSTPSA